MSQTKNGDSPKKHKLQNEWTLWQVEYDPARSWEDMLKKVDTFGTVEDFWNLYFRFDPPSKLTRGSDYMLFKKHIPPMWEDPANSQGGRWLVCLPKSSTDDLDIIWLDVILCLIGEACENYDHICGALVRIRKKVNKVAIWTKDGTDSEAIQEIGNKLRDVVRFKSNQTLQYREHIKEFHILKID
ncbi:eukaryotic translation initiation factor 4E1 [Drosophila biarmipes]|uniref:eukaryotic translation initiation factor 4E1 n=1 Tax=Drosophila biarmipes TaxID=125945 RepID=UPI0007E7E4E8|nr:eukaryotic translation initiation factor 4E1 [Drosophila biarmipes]